MLLSLRVRSFRPHQVLKLVAGLAAFRSNEFLGRRYRSSTKNKNSISLSQEFTITAWDSGSYYIAPIVFSENKKTEGLILKVNPIILNDSIFMIPNTPLKIGKNEDLTEKEREDERRRTSFLILKRKVLCFID